MKSVVLIDDDKDDLEFIQEAFSTIDPSITCYPFLFADEAIAYLSSPETTIPDYIFIDINMPKINGLECLDMLMKITHLERARFIMISTTLSAQIRNLLKQTPRTHAFEKPYTINGYVDVLKKNLSY